VELPLCAGVEPAVRNLDFSSEAICTASRRKSHRFVECALLLAFVAVTALVAVKGLGSGLSLLFTTASSSL
jgi:hypothetical protein